MRLVLVERAVWVAEANMVAGLGIASVYEPRQGRANCFCHDRVREIAARISAGLVGRRGNRIERMRILLAIAFALTSTFSVAAQIAVPQAKATPFRDTSMLKAPAHAKVAIIEFEDLECPLCAYTAPIVRSAMEHYKIPRVHHDFIITSHVWSRNAAIDARYLEDKVSPKAAEDYRLDVFAHQQTIASKDDLEQFTRQWFKAHGQPMPFVVDPSGRCAAEVEADCTLGARLGLLHTPTLVVVTAHRWIEVTDPNQLYTAIDMAEREANAVVPVARGDKRR